MKTVGFFWLGSELPWFNQVAIRTFQEIGHPIEVFCEPILKDTVKDLPLRDYREIVDEALLERLGPKLRVSADIFRLLLMRDSGHVWVDCDSIALKPLPNKDLILAKANSESDLLNNNVLRIPANAPELIEALDIALDIEAIPEWVPARRSQKARLQSGKHRREIITARQTTFAPDLLNYVFRNSDAIECAFNSEYFNPIGNRDGYKLFSVENSIADVSTDKSCLVHFYQSNVREFLLRSGPIKGTIIGDLAMEFGFTPA